MTGAVMNPTLICPKCKSEIPLTESLAAPLIETTKREYEKRISDQSANIARREEAVAKERETLESQVAERIKQERGAIASQEAAKAKRVLATEIEQKDKDLKDLKDVLSQREEKLAQAQKTEADMIRKQRELDDAKREMDLTIEKRIQDQLAGVRDKSRKDAEEEANLKVAEKEQTIASMHREIEALRRKAEQGSQQLQGEVQELALENSLRSRFPMDSIEPVAKGEHGGDAIHRVVGPTGQPCGTILWESKRTKSWSDGWLPKLRDDQRAAKADVAVIVTQVLPKGIETFDAIDGVWITTPRAAVPVAALLRHALIEVATARLASDGQQTKMEILYQYLTGPRFRLRVQAIVEAFSTMKEDLDREKKALTKQWAKREEQIDRVMTGTAGMYGDLQALAGKSLQEIDGMSLAALEAPAQTP